MNRHVCFALMILSVSVAAIFGFTPTATATGIQPVELISRRSCRSCVKCRANGNVNPICAFGYADDDNSAKAEARVRVLDVCFDRKGERVGSFFNEECDDSSF